MTEQEKCDKFNKKYAYGTKGWLHKDNGDVLATHTRSEARVLGGHTAVISVNGITGCYDLKRFEPAY